jgi:cytochrome c oxidase subunit II
VALATFEGAWVPVPVLVRCDPPVRRRAFVQLALLAAVIAAATTAIAVAIPWLPVSASQQRDRIDVTYWLATGIAIFIFSIVAAAILFSVWRFRAHPDDDSDGPPIHGNTGLEIAWTAVPTALVTAIAIVSAIVLHDNGDVPKDALHVNVTAQQFTWTFEYTDGPAKGITAPNLYMPVHRAVELEITSVDVLHSFWVPQFGQKQDAVPGRTNPLLITPTKTGTYPVICTELCGLGHAAMRSTARVVSPSQFDAWVKRQRASGGGGPGGGAGGDAGALLFDTQGCSGCHEFKPAGSDAQVGPSLDNLAADAQKAGKSLEDYVHESIRDPGAYVVPGYQNGVMPTFDSLSDEQVDSLVQYLTEAKGGAT